MRDADNLLPPKMLLINLLPVQFTTLGEIDDDDDTMSSLLICFLLSNILLLGCSLYGIPHD
jgi:hypothetical protein